MSPWDRRRQAAAAEEPVQPPPAGLVRRECLRAAARRALAELRFVLPLQEGDPQIFERVVLGLEELGGGP